MNDFVVDGIIENFALFISRIDSIWYSTRCTSASHH